MNTIKKAVTIIILLFATTTITAQSSDALLGKWEGIYKENGEKALITYEFKQVKGKLKCYTVSIKGENGEEGVYESIVMRNVSLNSGNGKAIYIYNDNGEDYEFKAKLSLKSQNVLNISYSVMGYSDTEVWNRIK